MLKISAEEILIEQEQFACGMFGNCTWPSGAQGLTSHQTHYRSYRGRVLRVKWPNKQCQRLKAL